MCRRAGAAVLLLLIAGCVRGPREAAPIITHATVQVSHERAFGADTSRVVLAWPRFQGGALGVADSIEGAVQAFVLASWAGGAAFPSDDSLASILFAERARVERQTGMTAPWRLERTVEVAGDTLGTLSLALTESAYLGGAHPNTTVRLQIRDRRDGRRLRFADLFRPHARDSVSAVCEPYFRTARGLTHDAVLDTLGFWFESGRFRVNDNIALTSGGLQFRFDPYEIGPHALGPTDFVVPYAALRSFARADGPLTRDGR